MFDLEVPYWALEGRSNGSDGSFDRAKSEASIPSKLVPSSARNVLRPSKNTCSCLSNSKQASQLLLEPQNPKLCSRDAPPKLRYPALQKGDSLLFDAESPKEYETFILSRDPDYFETFEEFESQMRRILSVNEGMDVDVYYLGPQKDLVEKMFPKGADLFLCAVFDDSKTRKKVEALILAAVEDDLVKSREMQRLWAPVKREVRERSPAQGPDGRDPVVKREAGGR